MKLFGKYTGIASAIGLLLVACLQLWAPQVLTPELAGLITMIFGGGAIASDKIVGNK